MGFSFEFQSSPFRPVNKSAPLFCMAGPCALESRAHALEVSAALKEIFTAAGRSFLSRSSFDKANRSSGSSFRGVGRAKGLSILAEVRESVGVPMLTDVHTPEQAGPVAEVADMLQTPAFLCRQTDLIAAVAATGKPVNIKKGQFLAPWEMENVLQKARTTGNERICLCERGTSFGYGSLVRMYFPGVSVRLRHRVREVVASLATDVYVNVQENEPLLEARPLKALLAIFQAE